MKKKKLIYLTVSFLTSIILAYSIVFFTSLTDLRNEGYVPFTLFFLLILAGLNFIASRKQTYQRIMKVIRLSPKNVNIALILSIFGLAIWAVYNVVRQTIFAVVDYNTNLYFKIYGLLIIQRRLFLIVGCIILFTILVVYSYIYFSKIKKLTVGKSIVRSIGYSVAGIFLFGMFVIVVRILFYIILLFTIGISAG